MFNLSHLKAAAVVSALMFAAPAAASTCLGNCGTVAPNGDVAAPPGGGAIQYVSTDGGVAGAGQISGVSGTNGSEFISDSFAAGAGDPLAFSFNYITSDGSGYADYAFAELQTAAGVSVAYLFTARTVPSPGNTSPGFGLPANSATLTPATSAINPGATNFSPLGTSSGLCYSGTSNGCGNTGFINSLFNIGAAGNYRVRFGVTNFGDSSYESALAFSGLKIADVPIGGAVPEPGTWALMLLGFGVMGSQLRRRKGATTSLRTA